MKSVADKTASMTRPDEIAALADAIRAYGNRLLDEAEHSKEVGASEAQFAATTGAAVISVVLGMVKKHCALSATSPGDAVRDMVERWQKDEAALEAAFGRVGVDEFGDGPEVLRNLGTAIHFAKGLIGKAALAPAEKAGDDLVSYFERQIEWSRQTFGPALRTKGVIDHIRKELREIEDAPHDLSEWVDVIILAMDGFWRHGGEATALLPALLAKQQKNMARTWPDWRSMSEDGAIEHDRTKDATPTPPSADVAWLIQRLRSWEKDPAATHRVNGRTRRLLKEAATMLAIQSAAHGCGTESDGGLRPTVDDAVLAGKTSSRPSLPIASGQGVHPIGPSDTVDCPDCRGSGSRTISVAGCCENPTRTGECCGNAIEVPSYEECSSCGGSGMVPGPSDPAQEPEDLGDALERQGFTIGRPSLHSKLRGAISATPAEIVVDKTLIGAQEPQAVAKPLDDATNYLAGRCFTIAGHHGFLDNNEAFAIAVALYRAGLLRPVSLDREAVARIIDPEAFEAWDRAEGNWRKDEAKVRCWPAEEKADAILAKIEGRT